MEAGQDAFAAIQEVVLLEADPDTDWSRVDIDALRDHLIDMHLVTLYAKVDDGVELTVITDEDSDVARIRGLGFAGFMALGDHHQPHHLMMATGGFSHQH